MAGHWSSAGDIIPVPHGFDLNDEYKRMMEYSQPQMLRHEPTLLNQLAMRLRLSEATRFPFPFINAHRVNDERVIVFLVTENCVTGEVTPMVIEDDGHLYPSDALVTQIRLLLADTK